MTWRGPLQTSEVTSRWVSALFEPLSQHRKDRMATGVTYWGVTDILTLSATWGYQSSDPVKFSNWQAKTPNILFLPMTVPASWINVSSYLEACHYWLSGFLICNRCRPPSRPSWLITAWLSWRMTWLRGTSWRKYPEVTTSLYLIRWLRAQPSGGMSWLSWRNFILQEVNKKIENLYSKFKLMLLKRDDASKAALTKTLEKWVQCTQSGCKNNHKHSNFASSSSKNTSLHSGLTSCWPPRGRGSWLETPCAASTASWCRSCSTSGWQVRPCMQPAVLQCPLTPTYSGSLQRETTSICQVWHANAFCMNISRPGRVTLALSFDTNHFFMQYNFSGRKLSALSLLLPIKSKRKCCKYAQISRVD